MDSIWRSCAVNVTWVALMVLLSGIGAAEAQPAFAVASIRPSSAAVKFESDGRTETTPGTLHMQDVTLETCIKWAFGVQRGQISGPGVLTADRYDILAKADDAASVPQMKLMMRTLLKDRFKLAFHTEKKELRSFALVVARGGPKLKHAAPDEAPYRENSRMGMVARALTMQEFGDFLSDVLEKPVVDKTGQAGRWDFSFDFTNYMTDPPKGLDDYLRILNPTLEGDVGLKLESEKDVVDVMVIDHAEKASAN